jgi:hypothetical protein
VLRPGKVRFVPSQQVAIVALNYERIRLLLDAATEPTLVRVTPSSAQPRTLEELYNEITSRTQLP